MNLQVKLIQENQTTSFLIDSNDPMWVHYITDRSRDILAEFFYTDQSRELVESMKSYFLIKKFEINRMEYPAVLKKVRRIVSDGKKLLELTVYHKYPVEKFYVTSVSTTFSNFQQVYDGPFYQNKTLLVLEMPDDGYTFKITSTDYLEGRINPKNSTLTNWISECGLGHFLAIGH